MHGSSPGAIGQLARLLRPYAGRLVAALAMLFGLTGVNLALPMLLGLIFNEIFPEKNWTLLWIVLAAIFALSAVRNALFFGSRIIAITCGEELAFELRNRLFQHLQGMSLQFYRRNQPGSISSRVINDSFVVQSFVQEELPKLLQSGLLFVGLIATMYAVNWQLALAATFVLPLHLLAYLKFREPIRQTSKNAQEHLATATGNLIEKFLGMEVVKGFTAEDREGRAFERAIDLSRRSELRSKTFHVAQKIAADMVIALGMVALLGFGAWQVMGETAMQVGTFVAFFWYVKMLYPTVLELMSSCAKLSKSGAGIERVFDILDRVREERTGGLDPGPLRGVIRFEGVTLRYADGPAVLQGVDFTVDAGEVCAIVGPSGAGKTALCSLLPRFNEAESGVVRIDGHDVRELDAQALRRRIGISFQETFLFNSTVLENLRYANPDASFDQIVAVAKRTGAHETLAHLPDGYQTRIGEGGVSLSTGEKQRLSLTRAMLKDPQILILDEATASLDPDSQARIVPEILAFMQGKTTLMVTHRPELLEHADKVIRLDAGRVTYAGPAKGLDRSILTGQDRPAPERRPRAAEGSGAWRGLGAWLLAALVGVAAAAAHAAPATAPAPRRELARAFFPRPGTDEKGARELLQVAAMRARAQWDYRRAEPGALPIAPPAGVRRVAGLVRSGEEGERFLLIGYRPFDRQPLHVWLAGGRRTGDGAIAPNDDLAELRKLIAGLEAPQEKKPSAKSVHELATERVTLSYVSTSRCMGTLSALGYHTVVQKAAGKSAGGQPILKPASEVDPAKLPIVMALPNRRGAGQLGKEQEPTAVGPMNELLVLYHPEKPEQLGRLRKVIRETIDQPARQIVIEAMVLEISETALEKLGVQWQLQSPLTEANLSELDGGPFFGTLPNFEAGESATANIQVDNVFGEFKAQIQALVRDGKAEILSRPSVLTLGNRQAHIRVGEDIPILTSAQATSGGGKLNFNFRYIEVGITLDVRPRVTADGEEISMQIDGEVAAEVPGEQLDIRDQAGNLLASAPQLSRRNVQTYARIHNNTPFIIGGLVSKEKILQEDKVPLLGDVPLIKELFRTSRLEKLKREVIIVITPYVLPEKQVVGRNLPKDTDAFDSFGNELFRDAYRIRAEDVFDLDFLKRNKRLHRAQKRVRRLLEKRPELGKRYPFAAFADDGIPGESILVYRQIYEVIKRLDLSDAVNPGRIIFFRPDESSPSGFSVTFLKEHIPALDGGDERIAPAGKALALTYTVHRNRRAEKLLEQPVPRTRLVDCPDRQAWSRLMWRMNQPDEGGRNRFTILLQTRDDLKRLKRALIVKRAVELNGKRRAMTLENFSVGRQLLMPEVKRDKVRLIDSDVARYFFYTEQYYPAVQQRLSRALKVLETAIGRRRKRSALEDGEPSEVAEALDEPAPEVARAAARRLIASPRTPARDAIVRTLEAGADELAVEDVRTFHTWLRRDLQRSRAGAAGSDGADPPVERFAHSDLVPVIAAYVERACGGDPARLAERLGIADAAETLTRYVRLGLAHGGAATRADLEAHAEAFRGAAPATTPKGAAG